MAVHVFSNAANKLYGEKLKTANSYTRSKFLYLGYLKQNKTNTNKTKNILPYSITVFSSGKGQMTALHS